MKKISAISIPLASFLALARSAFAVAEITIDRPSVGYDDLGTFLNRAITLAFIIAAIGVLVMLVWGAVAWIFSGGDKTAIEGAQKRIINAFIGLAILAVAFALARVAGQFLGFDLLGTFTIPSPGNAGHIPGSQ